jgi:RNA polymerase sigma-70 factor (ECF subfamily)
VSSHSTSILAIHHVNVAEIGLTLAGGAEESARSNQPADREVARLSRAIAAGDDAAFREFYDRFHDRVFRLALVLARGDETAAKELAQTVMLTAAEKLGPVSTEAHLWNWLARVARQQCGKRARRNAREGRVLVFGESPEAVAEPDPDRQLENALNTAMDALDADARRLVEMFYHEGQSHQEIGEKLGASPKAIANRMERARGKLRELISKGLRRES